MVTVRLVNAQAVADVMLALRRDAAQNRVVARQCRERYSPKASDLARAQRLDDGAMRLEELALAIDGQLTVNERIDVAHCAG